MKRSFPDSFRGFHIDSEKPGRLRCNGRKFHVGIVKRRDFKNRITRAKRIHINQHQLIARDQYIFQMKIRMQECVAVGHFFRQRRQLFSRIGREILIQLIYPAERPFLHIGKLSGHHFNGMNLIH